MRAVAVAQAVVRVQVRVRVRVWVYLLGEGQYEWSELREVLGHTLARDLNNLFGEADAWVGVRVGVRV